MSTLDQSKSRLSGFLPIEKPTIDIVPHPPKGIMNRIICIILTHAMLAMNFFLRK